jgi:hypothetical protein
MDRWLKTGSLRKVKEKRDRFKVDEKQEVASTSDMGAREHKKKRN